MLLLALFSAAVGSLILFDAEPGLNLGLWATLVGASVAGVRWMEWGRVGRLSAALLILGCALAWGAAVTGNGAVVFFDLVAAFVVFSLALLVAPDESAALLPIQRVMVSPIEAPVRALGESGRRLQAAVAATRRESALPVVRGVVMAVPVVAVFAVALSGADPVFALWRERSAALIGDFPAARTAFGVMLFVACVGAFGLAMRGGVAAPRLLEVVPLPGVRLGATERLIVLGAVASLFATFLILQITYLFGNAPAVPGSGVTFAEYARRGFFELTFVAVACWALLVLVRGTAERSGDAYVIRALELMVVGEVLLMLVSAFRKMMLYEAAYGYTVARVWGQAFMVGIAISLAVLGWELRGAFDVHRLARRTAATGAAVLLTLTYWNHDAWIVGRNLERYRETGRFDASYAANRQTVSAVPAAIVAARQVGGSVGTCLEQTLRRRWQDRVGDDAWYETNLARARASRAIRATSNGSPGSGGVRDEGRKCRLDGLN